MFVYLFDIRINIAGNRIPNIPLDPENFSNKIAKKVCFFLE